MELKCMQQLVILHRRLLVTKPTASEDSYGGGDSDFDTDMVIILAFLLCALLFAIGLNAFLRCGLLDMLRDSSTDQAAAPGLKKRALRQLPVAVYGSRPDIYAKECPICLGEFLDGERIRVLPKCGHGFHVGCIDTWLTSNGSCPNCRISLCGPRQAPARAPRSSDLEAAGRERQMTVDTSSQ